MRKFLLLLALTGGAALVQQSAIADHNSPNGAGWARMPNDIHNTRIDTLGNNAGFRDFVRYGNGADSTNRYWSDSSYGRGSRSNVQGYGSGQGNGDRHRNRAGHGHGGGRGRGR